MFIVQARLVPLRNSSSAASSFGAFAASHAISPQCHLLSHGLRKKFFSSRNLWGSPRRPDETSSIIWTDPDIGHGQSPICQDIVRRVYLKTGARLGSWSLSRETMDQGRRRLATRRWSTTGPLSYIHVTGGS